MINSFQNLKQLSTVFIYFNSECESCSLETIKLKKRLTDFENKEIIFISYENKDSILKFARKHQLYNKENIRFLEDKKGVFSQFFNIETIPYIFVYDREKQLKGKFKGITKIDKILEALK